MSVTILFAGTPEMAVPSLVKIAALFRVVGVLTGPDSVAGRGRKLTPSPVKQKALELGIPAYTPEKLDPAFRETVSLLKPDLLVVVAYGKIFGPKFLGLFPMGGINLHPSLLPKYRGPSPIPAAILNGDPETGITIQRISLRMDAGPILLQETLPLDGTETTGSLTELCGKRGAELLARVIRGLEAGSITERPQEESQASYCGLITKEHGRVDWNLPAVRIERMVRAYDPWPNAWTLFRGEVLKILKASLYPTGVLSPNPLGGVPGKVVGVDKEKGILIQTGEGILCVQRLQLQARNAMDFRAFLNGVRDFTGTVLGA